jgi:hypothetical protein
MTGQVPMETEKLIARLATEAGAPRVRLARSVALRLVLGTFVPSLFVLLILLTVFTPSPHLGHAFGRTIAFTLASGLVLVGSALAASLALSRPETAPKTTLFWLPAAIIFASGIAAELAFVPRQEWFARMVGANPLGCFASVFVLSLPVLAGALWALRHGAPMHPRVAGAFAGLLAAGVTAVLYLLHCPEDSLLFTLAWHVPALLSITALGGALGGIFLRW